MWEANYANAFCRLLKPGDTVLDIGANHGFYSLIAASRIAPGGRIHAFEPSRNFYELIRASVSVNGLGEVVSVHNVALGDSEGEVRLTYNPGWSGGANISMTEVPGAESGLDSEAVRCVVLDSYLGDQLPRVDVIKMDIEGAEGIALKGMTQIIDRSPGLRMMMEFCPAMMSRFPCDAEFVVDFLRRREFLAWTIDDEGGLVPARWEALLQDRDAIRNVIVSRRALA
jgi:FkbM family methyltransferase